MSLISSFDEAILSIKAISLTSILALVVADGTSSANGSGSTNSPGLLQMILDSISCPKVCEKCVNVVDQIKVAASNPDLVAGVKEKLHLVCEERSPDPLECKKEVDKMVDHIVNEVEAHGSREICAKLRLCPNEI